MAPVIFYLYLTGTISQFLFDPGHKSGRFAKLITHLIKRKSYTYVSEHAADILAHFEAKTHRIRECQRIFCKCTYVQMLTPYDTAI